MNLEWGILHCMLNTHVHICAHKFACTAEIIYNKTAAALPYTMKLLRQEISFHLSKSLMANSPQLELQKYTCNCFETMNVRALGSIAAVPVMHRHSKLKVSFLQSFYIAVLLHCFFYNPLEAFSLLTN